MRIENLEAKDHGWLRHFHYGDWLALDGPNGGDSTDGGTDKEFIAANCYLESMRLTAEAAKILGKEDDAEYYRTLADRMLEYIRAEYITPNGRCAVATQTGYLLALKNGLNPKERAERELINKVKECNGMLKTGFVGTPLLCPGLTSAGKEDMAFDLLLNEEYPGWLYEVKLGATTVWERWNSVLPDGHISSTGMNSLNHYAYGSVVQWIYESVAGISPAEPGFRKAVLAPNMHRELDHVDMTFRSAAGNWEVHWKIFPEKKVRYACTVPFGCTADLKLPYGGPSMTLEAGSYEWTYETDRDLMIKYSVDTPLGVLLTSSKVRPALEKFMPDIAQVPTSMYGMTMRDISEQIAHISDEYMAQIDAFLSTL